jgi:hypothetical protein
MNGHKNDKRVCTFLTLWNFRYTICSQVGWLDEWMNRWTGWPSKRRVISHLLALLGAHHILHVNRVRVNEWMDRRMDIKMTNLYAHFCYCEILDTLFVPKCSTDMYGLCHISTKDKERTGTVSRLRSGRSGVRFPSHPERGWDQPSLRCNGYWAVLDHLAEKQPEHESVNSPASSVEVKNRWSYTSVSLGCLHGGERVLPLPLQGIMNITKYDASVTDVKLLMFVAFWRTIF